MPLQSTNRPSAQPTSARSAPLPRRVVPQHRLAHAPRHDHQLGGRHNRDRPDRHLQQLNSLASAPCPGRAARGRVPLHRGPPVSLFRLLAHSHPCSGAELLWAILRGRGPRIDNGWNEILARTTRTRDCTSRGSRRLGAVFGEPTAGSFLFRPPPTMGSFSSTRPQLRQSRNSGLER